LRLDDATDTIVCSKVWVEISHVAKPFFHSKASLEKYKTSKISKTSETGEMGKTSKKGKTSKIGKARKG
jgi:hypothetical protein